MNIETEYIGPSPMLCVDVARGAGPAVLFLHGIGGARGNWAAQLSALAGRYCTIAIDARGYGDSGDTESARVFTDFADDAVRVLNYFNIERAHVVGLSMGGRVALDLWNRHRTRVASMTLADCSAGSTETQAPEKVEAFLAARRKPLLEGKSTADIAPEVAKGLAGADIAPAAWDAIVASLAGLRAGPYLKTLEAVTRFTDFPDLGGIDVPTQIIVGSADRVAPPNIMRTMAQMIPDARYAEIEGAGHISNIEAPEQFNAILHEFLESVA